MTSLCARHSTWLMQTVSCLITIGIGVLLKSVLIMLTFADNTNIDDYASGSDTPQVGDEVVQLGHPTDEERQSAIIQSAAGEGAPYFKIIKGINSFILPPPIFLFDNQKFEIRVEKPSRQGEYIRLQDYLSSMQSRIDSVKEQTDHQFLICFGDAIPTLTNEPANEWTDDETKEMHLHDLLL